MRRDRHVRVRLEELRRVRRAETHGQHPAGATGPAHDTGDSRGPGAGGLARAPIYAKAQEGIAHLQAAARELIAAARKALDVAEDLVDDPDTVASLTGVADTVTGLVRSVVPNRRNVGGDGSAAGGADAGPTPGVEHIQVS